MRARAFLVAGSALALAACVAGPPPEIATPTPQLPDTFLYAPAGAEDAAMAALLPSGDPAFEALSAQALASSPTLAEAAARIEQARAGADGARARRMPEIGASGNATGTRTNPAQFSSSLPPGVSPETERVAFGANLTARWDPDLFGRLRAQERAALARIDAADASARAVRIALLSEIAAGVIDWRTLAARENQLQQDLDSAMELARLAGLREKAGITAGFDRIRAESVAASSRSRLAALDNERARVIGRLVGLSAQGAEPVRDALAVAPSDWAMPLVPATVPSELLVNRPDVLAAAATLAAEDFELAAAARRRFPAFDLAAGLGLLAFGIGDLFDSDSIVGSLAASIAAPLLDFGRLQAEIDGASAEKKAAFQRYRGAVYTALGDAEEAFGLVAAADREALASQEESASLRRAAQIAQTRQRAGLTDFLTVLEARRAADASGERAAAAMGRARRARVVLWQALGGR